jgi:hypothetical protein
MGVLAIQLAGGFGADAGKPFVGEEREELHFSAGRHKLEGGRFFEFGSDLADEFVGGDAFANGEPEGLANGVADGLGDADSGFARAGQVEVAFVDRADFHVGCEIIGIGEHQAGEELVFFEITGQEDEFRAKPASHDCRHGGVNAEFAGFIGGGGNDAALFAADGDRFAAQMGISRLFDRGEKGVGVQMHDKARRGHADS